MLKTDTYEEVADIQTAIQLLRPDAIWKIKDNKFINWQDERPCPSMEEVYDTIEKINRFKQEVKTIWTDEQLEKQQNQEKKVQEALDSRP